MRDFGQWWKFSHTHTATYTVTRSFVLQRQTWISNEFYNPKPADMIVHNIHRQLLCLLMYEPKCMRSSFRSVLFAFQISQPTHKKKTKLHPLYKLIFICVITRYKLFFFLLQYRSWILMSVFIGKEYIIINTPTCCNIWNWI